MKKIVNIYNGYLGSSDQGGGINYVENLIQKQNYFFSEIYVLGLGNRSFEQKTIGKTKVNYYSISNSHNWFIFCIKLFFFLIFKKKKFSGAIFHIHRSYFSLFIKIIKKSKVILTVHTKTFDVFEKKFPYLRFLVHIFKLIEYYILKNFIHKTTFSGQYAIKLYQKRYNLKKNKLIYLPLNFSFKHSLKKHRYLKKEKKKIILFIGRLTHVKRPFETISIFKKAISKDKFLKKNFKLYLVGTGDLFNSVQKFIKKNKLNKNVILLKKIDSKNMPQVYKCGHSLICLSSSETGPTVVKEALFSGIPVFSTNVGQVKKIINNNNGKIIPVNNPSLNVNEYINFLKKKFNKKKIKKNFKLFLAKEEKTLEKTLNKIYR